MSENATTLSRRQALTCLAATTAAGTIAVPATASVVAAATITENAAGLLALAPQLNHLFDEWLAMTTAERNQRDEIHQLIKEAREAAGIRASCHELNTIHARIITEQMAIRYPDGNDDEEDSEGRTKWDRFSDQADPLISKIFSYSVPTPEGIALKLRALFINETSLWARGGNSLILSKLELESLLSDICVHFGVTPPYPWPALSAALSEAAGAAIDDDAGSASAHGITSDDR
jgi:hypothetical protein